MGVTGVDHMTVNVTDMEDSIRFYEELLGFQKKEQVDMGNHVIQYMETEAGDRLELIQYYYATEQISEDPDCRGIYRHIAYRVTDLDDLWIKLQAAGAVVLSVPAECKKLQFRNVLLRDPNGVEIELVERS